ncbi:MAG: hypothetical protein AAGD05_16015 [Bacteroidota bacterium]
MRSSSGQTTTKQLTINRHPLKVQGFSTGKVSVKTKFRETPFRRLLAPLSLLLDRQFTEWIPIWIWVIEHLEGIFVVNTGETAAVNNQNYFDSSGWFAKWLNTPFRFDVQREEEIDA